MYIKSCAKFTLSFLLVVTSIQFSFEASIYYEKPSSARLAAASHSPPACKYQNKKYAHGERVVTPEPCLNCTCKKGVLLCFLRVCPTLIPSSPNENCETIREHGQCCPTLKCETRTTTSSSITTQLTESELSSSLQSVGKVEITTEKPEIIPTTIKPLHEREVTVHSSAHSSNDWFSSVTKLIDNRVDNRITVTHKEDSTTIFQTSPSTTFHDSIVLVTSSPSSLLEQDNIINSIQGGCYMNGTIYAEGSAVLSTSFCEYCYCIRSRRMCIRPRCHLSILGCLPRYTSEYACCPTSYVCGEHALTTLPATTTTTTSTESTVAYARKSVCIEKDLTYHIGDSIPSDEHCKRCYCSTGAVKKCKRIQCSPAMEGCVPIIPEDHCCPVEYKCNTTQRTRSDEIDNSITTPILVTTKRTSMPILDDTIAYSTEPFTSTIKGLEIDSVTPDNVPPELSERKVDAEISEMTESIESGVNSTPIPYQTTPLNKSIPFDVSESDENLISTENIKDIDHFNPHYAFIDEPIALSLKSNAEDDYSNSTPVITTNVPVSRDTPDYSVTQTTLGNLFTSTVSTLSYIPSNVTTPLELTTTVKPIPKTNIPAIDRQENNDNSDSEESTNSTSSNLENILEGIIHAIDKHIHRRLPAEPRESLWNKNQRPNETFELKSATKLVDENPKDNSQLSRSQISFKNKGVSSSILIADDSMGNYGSGSGIEIITSRTPFHDLNHDSDDSKFINISPNNMKVGASITMGSKYGVQNNPFVTKVDRVKDYSYTKPQLYPTDGVYSSNNWHTITNQHQAHHHGNTNHGNTNHGNTNYGNTNHGQTIFKRVGSVESLYYNGDIKREDKFEPEVPEAPEVDKRPRLEATNPHLKVIPFKIQDAFNGMSPAINKRNGSFVIRLQTPPKPFSSTAKPIQQTSCFYNAHEFPNGAMIPKPDPCILCRCFYGREMCQEQKCPAPPERDCSPEKVQGYCCPRYICRIIDDGRIQRVNSTVPIIMGSLSGDTIRKGPQFPSTASPVTSELVKNQIPFINITELVPENVNTFDDTSSKEEIDRFYQTLPEYPAVPSNVHGLQSKYPPFPLDPTPKPYSNLPFNGVGGSFSNVGNRVHFPMNFKPGDDKERNDHIHPIRIQPPRADTISALIPPRPRPMITNNRVQNYQGINNQHIKPLLPFNQQSPQLTQTSSTPSISYLQRPQIRVPPFLVNSRPNPYGYRPKPNGDNNHNGGGNNGITSSSTILSSDLFNYEKPVITPIINKNISSGVMQKVSEIIPVKELSNDVNKVIIEASSSIPPSASTETATQSSASSTASTVILEISTKSKSTTNIVTSAPLKDYSKRPLLDITTSTTTETPKTSSITTTTEKVSDTTPKSKISNPWDLLRVSGCNIYGTFYKVDEEIYQLNSHCKRCLCSSLGVKCDSIC